MTKLSGEAARAPSSMAVTGPPLQPIMQARAFLSAGKSGQKGGTMHHEEEIRNRADAKRACVVIPPP
jgi:hypothetical protein